MAYFSDFLNKYSENILSSAQLKQDQVIDTIFTLYSFKGGILSWKISN